MTSSNSSAASRPVSFAYVTNSRSGFVSGFSVSSSGGLSLLPGSPFQAGAGAEFTAFDPIHKLLFVGNAGAASLSVFSVNTGTGMLTPVQGSPFATGARPEGVAVDPMGRFVFVANQGASSISVFSITATGTLNPVTGSPFTANSPFGLAVNPSGTILYANNFPDSQTSDFNSVSAFQILSNGTLSAVSGSPFPTASSSSGFASAVGLVTDGKLLFVADHMAETVVAFNVDSATGALKPLGSLPTPGGSCGGSCHRNPLRLAIDPQDRFLYWTNVQAGTVSAFNINNGVLSPIGEIVTGQHPFGVAVDPTGNFLYAVNKVDGTVSVFVANHTTGALTAISGSPFKTGGAQPTDIAIVARQ
jgi:6-phosphogluconolactonase